MVLFLFAIFHPYGVEYCGVLLFYKHIILSGFSERNIKRRLRFYREYPNILPIMPQAVAQLQNVNIFFRRHYKGIRRNKIPFGKQSVSWHTCAMSHKCNMAHFSHAQGGTFQIPLWVGQSSPLVIVNVSRGRRSRLCNVGRRASSPHKRNREISERRMEVEGVVILIGMRFVYTTATSIFVV